MSDYSKILAEKVKKAYVDGTILNISSGNSKSFLFDEIADTRQVTSLSVSEHQGIVNYEPNELVLTARSGTLLKDIKNLLSKNKQMLAFEPPSYGDEATLGGTIACGLSGPRRPYAGAARDFVLGVRMINGRGEVLRFGGEVMKNVAGYDVSRLVTGAMGTLGALLEISLKVLPVADTEITLVQKLKPVAARKRMLELARQYLPISGMSYVGQYLYIRLSGTRSSVAATVQKIGGELVEDYTSLWHDLLEQAHPFFKSDQPLWRLSLPVNCNWHEIQSVFDCEYLVDWGGALVWLTTNEDPEKIFYYAQALGGHGQLYRHAKAGYVYRHQPLSPGLMNWHKKLKQAFDPKSIFNPGRMYRDL